MSFGLLQQFATQAESPGATEAELSAAEAELGRRIPPEYRRFLKMVNGAEGEIGQHYVKLWDIQTVVQGTRAYQDNFESNDEAFDLAIVIGGNGSGEVLGIRMVSDEEEYILFPSVSLDPEDRIILGRGIEQFGERLRAGIFPST